MPADTYADEYTKFIPVYTVLIFTSSSARAEEQVKSSVPKEVFGNPSANFICYKIE